MISMLYSFYNILTLKIKNIYFLMFKDNKKLLWNTIDDIDDNP